MKKEVFYCDINTCNRECDATTIFRVQIIDKIYELCRECFTAMQDFAAELLPDRGKTVTEDDEATDPFIEELKKIKDAQQPIQPYVPVPSPWYDPQRYGLQWIGDRTIDVKPVIVEVGAPVIPTITVPNTSDYITWTSNAGRTEMPLVTF